MYTQLYNHFHDTAQFANSFREILFVIVVVFLFILGDSSLAQKVNFLARSFKNKTLQGLVTVIWILPINVKIKIKKNSTSRLSDKDNDNDDDGQLAHRYAAG